MPKLGRYQEIGAEKSPDELGVFTRRLPGVSIAEAESRENRLPAIWESFRGIADETGMIDLADKMTYSIVEFRIRTTIMTSRRPLTTAWSAVVRAPFSHRDIVRIETGKKGKHNRDDASAE